MLWGVLLGEWGKRKYIFISSDNNECHCHEVVFCDTWWLWVQFIDNLGYNDGQHNTSFISVSSLTLLAFNETGPRQSKSLDFDEILQYFSL